MIGLAKACKGGGALGNYVIDEKKGYELDRNLICGANPKEIIEEIQMIQLLNQRAMNKTFSLVLSPDISDSSKLSDNELREITKQYLKELGINPQEQQYIAFVHTEKEHKHIHIIANRVTMDGKLISDHKIGKRAQWVAHRIAKEKGLVSAKEKMIDNIKSMEQKKGNYKELRTEIHQKHLLVMSKIPNYFKDYQKGMKTYGIDVNAVYNKQGRVQGHKFIDLHSGREFKASEIHRDLGLRNLNHSKQETEHSEEKINTPSITNITLGRFIHILNAVGSGTQNNFADEKKKKLKRKKGIRR